MDMALKSTCCKQGGVIILNAEDDPADTIIPRLKANNADLSKIEIIYGAASNTMSHDKIALHFDLSKDLKQLDNMLNDLKHIALVIVDSITAFLGSIDGHINSDVRGMLAPLAKLAEKYNVAIVCVSHLNKNQKQQALMRQGHLIKMCLTIAVIPAEAGIQSKEKLHN